MEALVSVDGPFSQPAGWDTTAPDTIGGEGMHSIPFPDPERPSVDLGMLIRTDTTVDPEILEMPAPDGLDPEMVLPPWGRLGEVGETARPFPESRSGTDTLGTDGPEPE
jgi:hypothetical protein